MRQRADDRLRALFFSFGAAFVDTVVWDNEPSVSAEGQESRHKCTVESTESPFNCFFLLYSLCPQRASKNQTTAKKPGGLEIECRCRPALCFARESVSQC